MKISHIVDTFGRGGKERRCLQLIQGLNAKGYTDIQLIIVNGKIAYSEIYDCSCSICNINRHERNLGFVNTINEIRNHLKNFKPDIVQVWGLMSSLMFNLIRPACTCKVIYSYVADVIIPRFPKIHYFTNLLCKYTGDRIVGNSLAGLNAYSVPNYKRALIYNGFNEARFAKVADISQIKEKLSITTDKIVIMVATFSDNKDYDCYVAAARLICKYRDDITFLAVGDGKHYNRIKSTISSYEARLIKLLGQREDVDSLLQIANLSVLTSNCKVKEGLSNSILESMAFGIPVLATKGGGTPEIITDGKNGFLIEEQTPRALAFDIVSLLDNPQMLLVAGANAKKTVLEGFLLSTMTDKYIDMYRNCLNESY